MVNRKMLKQHVVYRVPSEDRIDEVFYRQLQTIPGLLPCTIVRWNGQQSLVYMTHNKEPIKDSEHKRVAILTLLSCVERVMQDETLRVTCLSLREEDIWVDKQTGSVGLIYCEVLEKVSQEMFGHCLQQRVSELCDSAVRQLLAEWLLLNGDQALRGIGEVIALLSQRVYVLESLQGDVPFCWRVSKKEMFVIGKSVHANGCLSSQTSVSHIHCRLHYDRQAWWIEDLGSVNGTFVNDTGLLPFHKQKVSVGETIRIADVTCQLKERYAI